MISNTYETYTYCIKSSYFLNRIFRKSHSKQCRLNDFNFFSGCPKETPSRENVCSKVSSLSLQIPKNSSMEPMFCPRQICARINIAAYAMTKIHVKFINSLTPTSNLCETLRFKCHTNVKSYIFCKNFPTNHL